MPYENGKRISMDEWTRLHSTNTVVGATSERGVNPGGTVLNDEPIVGTEKVDEEAQPELKQAQEDPSVSSDSPAALEESDAIREEEAPKPKRASRKAKA